MVLTKMKETAEAYLGKKVRIFQSVLGVLFLLIDLCRDVLIFRLEFGCHPCGSGWRGAFIVGQTKH